MLFMLLLHSVVVDADLNDAHLVHAINLSSVSILILILKLLKYFRNYNYEFKRI